MITKCIVFLVDKIDGEPVNVTAADFEIDFTEAWTTLEDRMLDLLEEHEEKRSSGNRTDQEER